MEADADADVDVDKAKQLKKVKIVDFPSLFLDQVVDLKTARCGSDAFVVTSTSASS